MNKTIRANLAEADELIRVAKRILETAGHTKGKHQKPLWEAALDLKSARVRIQETINND